MAISITIAGVDRTAHVVFDPDAFGVRASIRDADRATFTVVDRLLSTSAAYRPALFDTVVIADTGGPLLNGVISKVSDAPIVGPRKGTRVSVEATGAPILDRLLVTQDYVVGPHPILNSAVSSPTSLTVVNHGFTTGQWVTIEGHEGSTPSINGVFVVTVQGPNNVSIPINVSVAGGGGTIRRVMTLHEIVSHLHGIYLSPSITWDAINPTGPTLEAPTFDAVTVRAAFSALQGLSGYVIRVLPTNVLQFFPPGAMVASYSLTAANGLNVGAVTWDAALGQYANTLILKYGAEVQTQKTAVFTGTGALNNWTLEYEPVLDANGFIVSAGVVLEGVANLPIGLLAEIVTSAATGDVITTLIPHGFDNGASITIQGHTGSTPSINGTHTITVLSSHTFSIPVNITTGGTGGTCYAPALTWHYWPPANQLFRTSALASKAIATFGYTVQFPQVLVLTDAPEIALHGVWETQRTVTTIFDVRAATEWGTALLRRLKSQTVKTVHVVTRQAMPYPGDTMTLTFTDKLVSGAHLLTEISGTADADKQMRWTVTAAAGTEVVDDWMDLLRDTIGSGGGTSVVGGGGVVSGGYIPPTTTGGGGGGAGTGTVGTLARFDTTTTVADSIVTQSGSAISVAGTVAATSYTGTALASASTLTLSAASHVAIVPGGDILLKPQGIGGAVSIWSHTGDNLGAYKIFDNTGATQICSMYGIFSDLSQHLNSAGSLYCEPTGDMILDPGGNDVLPATGYDINLGQLAKKYLTLHAAELWVETLVAQNTIATIGGRILVLPTNILAADLSTSATTITVKYNNFASGDRVYMEGLDRLTSSPSVEFMAVTSGAGGSAGAYTYTVTRNLDGTGANSWTAGDAIANTGTTGDGWIDLYSISGVLGTGIGPSIVGNVRQSATYNDWAARWAVGNLNGLYGYATDVYGAAFGNPAAENLVIDATNGIRIRSGTTVYAVLSGSTFRVGASGGNRLEWNNATLTVQSEQLTINDTGVHLAITTAYADPRGYAFTPGANIAGAQFGLFAKEADATNRYLGVRNIVTTNSKTAWVELSAETRSGIGATVGPASIQITANGSTGATSVIVGAASIVLSGDVASSGQHTFSGGALVSNNPAVLASTTYLRFDERSSTPSASTSNTEVMEYLKADKKVLAFNRGGTMHYYYLDLAADSGTWVHTTTAP